MTANPRVSGLLMAATYILGGVGYALGFARLGSSDTAVTPVALVSVGVVGIVSMVRHSIFNRSDAARMGWDLGRRDNFQIEVGFANGAIGLVALIAVLGDWGTVAQAALTLIYALYFLQVAALSGLLLREEGGSRDAVRRLAVMLLQAGMLGFFAVAALVDVGAAPF